MILEVLSPSTERYDRGRKWLAYQALPDLRHFVLVAQDQRRIEAYHREDAGWRYELLQAPDAVLRLDAVAVALRLDEIYAVVPMLATAHDDHPLPAPFGPAQVARIAALKGLPVPGTIEKLLSDMDAEECAAAVAVLVGLTDPPAEAWRAILPERLHCGWTRHALNGVTPVPILTRWLVGMLDRPAVEVLIIPMAQDADASGH